jgi:hypothetical protein
LNLAVPRKGVQQDQQRSQRADHGIQKREHLDAACGCAFLHLETTFRFARCAQHGAHERDISPIRG